MAKRLFIMVEGNDDERFFRNIIKPILAEYYKQVKIWQYAQRPKETRISFLNSIKAMGADYIYVTDLDEFRSANERKSKIVSSFVQLNKERIVVVIKEIEAWYLAGLDLEASEKLGIDNLDNTNEIFKEDFNQLKPVGFGSRIDFMQEIIKSFSIEIGKKKNKSLEYFLTVFVDHALEQQRGEEVASIKE